ncbi:hypothetical protein CTAYLR_005983 [Chrysophaeum taylorii]|uniref:PITH domain-containing protein n=1 Tax=Chrysophaeum taylorii TaxID=2483200 RepID=A0AAD7U4T4_9STRA|nr:hypothetical protein CTAYLR_005983 [Chrysophaeum taylorii]
MASSSAVGTQAQAAAASTSIVDLSDLVVKEKCHCLNDSPGKPFGNVFIGDERLVCESEDDEQLLMTFEFREAVRLHSINVVAPANDHGPKTIKLFVNKQSIDFADCNDLPASQLLVLGPDDVAADRVCKLKMQNFTYVNLLSVFVEDNHGADVSQISSIKFFGSPLPSTNMKDFKKAG